MTDVQKLGGKLGPRIADITSRAVATTKQGTSEITHRTAVKVINTVFQAINAEQRYAVGELFDRLGSDPESPEWFSRISKIITEGTGQWGELVANAAIGGGISSSLVGVIVNELAPITLRLIEENPNLPHDSGTAARLVVQSRWGYNEGQVDAARNGLNQYRFDKLVESLYQAPGVSELLALLNREEISIGEAVDWMKRQGILPEARAAMLELRKYIHSPPDLALGVLKGVIPHGKAVEEGRKSGLDGEQMSFLEDITGEPPGIQDLLFAYRRGIINRERLEHGIRQSRLRLEWTDVIESLRFVPMSASAAIEAAVQGHVSDSESRKIVAENGIRPEDWQPLYDTAGNPPGPMEMLDLWNRGKMSQKEVEQGLRESRLKNKYIPTLLNLRQDLLTTGEISLAVAQGLMTQPQAIRYYMVRGFNQDDAATLAASASISRQARQYELTQAQIETLYLDGALTRKEAHKQIMDLGYDKDEADLILLTKDLQREYRYHEAVISRVHNQFVAHKLDKEGAQVALDALNIAAEQKRQLLDLWTLEKEANVAILSVAQIQGAWKRGIFTDTDAIDRFAALGYSTEDASILLALATPVPKGGMIGG